MMVQRTFYALPGEAPPEEPGWEPAPDDVHTLRHGYNVADLDVLARAAVRRVVGMRGDYRDRYETAWSAVAEHLYARETPPDPGDLVDAGRDALRRHVVDEMHHHGRRRAAEPGTTEPMPRYALYWDRVGWRPDPASIIERVAVWQVWADLRDRDREILGPLMAGLQQRDAAVALGMERAAYVMALRIARRHFLDRWHEGEQVPGQWGRAARAGETTTYRSAMLAARRRPSVTLPQPVHGKASTYGAGCRCVPCTTAATEETSARRRRRGGTAARRLVTDTDRAHIVGLSAAGRTVDQIMAETGWSRPTVTKIRRRARERGQL